MKPLSFAPSDNALAQALAHYRRWGRTLDDFSRDVAAYLENGCVVCTPRAFLLARPVCKDDAYAAICDGLAAARRPDTWYVHLFCGRDAFALLFAVMPFRLPYAGWRRADGVLRFYDLPRLEARFCGDGVRLGN